MSTPFGPGAIVIVYLRDPRERIWGELVELGATGISIRGADLQSFDEWLRNRASGGEPEIRSSLAFYPLARVERLLMDEPAAGVPSLDAQCIERTGRGIRELLADELQAVTAPES